MRKPVLMILLAVTLLLSACGPAVRPSTSSTTDSGEVFTVALPRIIVDYDLQGNPKVEGLDLAAVDRLVGSRISANLRVPATYVRWMQTANIQHVEMRQAGEGVNVFVNALAMPYLRWDDNSLQKFSALGALLNGPGMRLDLQFIARLMPIVRRLGLDLVLRFPRQGQAAEIPLGDINAAASLPSNVSAGQASYVLQFEVKYDPNGVPAVLGVSAADLDTRGIKLGNYRLDPNAIKRLQSANIQSVELRSKGDGFYVYINGDSLPNIVWDATTLKNAAQVYGQLNDQRDQYVSFVTQLLPQVNKADVGVLLHFPVAAGTQPIAVKMQ